MGPVDLDDVRKYIDANISKFHENRLTRLKQLKLSTILRRKNPYLFRAKDILTAQDLVTLLLDAHLSSQEETLFGDFLEGLAIYINSRVFGGMKSSAEGIDLEFSREATRFIVSIKSGPNWGNSSQIRRMLDNFRKAKRILRNRDANLHVRAVNGCCYGRDTQPDKGEYLKLCGQAFWGFISDDNGLYTKIIEPLGYNARQKNEQFRERYSEIVNHFTYRFIEHFCPGGKIDWEFLLGFNSSVENPDRELIKSLDAL